MKRGTSILNALVVAATLVLATCPTWAADDTTGRVTIESTSVAAGLGVSWGEGVLEYRGQRYPFTVTGFSIGDVGAAKVQAKGEVVNLRSVEEFEGVFMAAVAGGSLGGGASAAALHNQHGASMVWTSANKGLIFSLGHAGMTVKFTEEGQYQASRNGRKAAAQPQPAATPRMSQ